jgi:predicted negative regulator of RcsB-dependent stress response
MVGIGVALLIGALVAGVVSGGAPERCGGDRARGSSRFTEAMGANPAEYYVPEPANAEQAAKAREAALVELDAFVAAHSGSVAASIAAIKAAELEVDLGKLDAADQRLAALAGSLGPDDPKRAIALRLRGYTLDQRGQTLAAAETYADAANGIQRGVVWIEAGDSAARAKAPDAQSPHTEALAMAPGSRAAA